MVSGKQMEMEELIALLKKLPNPQAAWLAIEVELLSKTDFYFLSGAILQTVPENLRSNKALIENIANLSNLMLDRFDRLYKGDPSEFNNHRKQLRESIMGWLSVPKSVRFPIAGGN